MRTNPFVFFLSSENSTIKKQRQTSKHLSYPLPPVKSEKTFGKIFLSAMPRARPIAMVKTCLWQSFGEFASSVAPTDKKNNNILAIFIDNWLDTYYTSKWRC